ncbi:Biogenesis of lysosome-related organelles complex 1 subunit [Sesamum angolense]|uniref:Biogenesis of lysosome-related organelles complex 1 subunit n=1 Tax=Sesamum angolense TaxID=2727404 RepID=A0AAE1XD81_9LAMI|nr:Biogenesis of lysosome-related organelles complex 1 subunit [Sesamum angolense]
MASAKEAGQDQLAASLNDLFTSVSTMIKGELQGTNNILELLENMNLRVAEEYKGFGDVASGLRVFVEQLKSKSSTFDDYVQQLDAIEQQVTEFEAVVSMLDKYVSLRGPLDSTDDREKAGKIRLDACTAGAKALGAILR